VENTTNEIVAQAIHSAYVMEQQKAGKTIETNPSMRSWEELPETLRRSNRNQADHICTKLRAVNCEMRRKKDRDPETVQFTPEEIEFLAEMEHDRWVEEREGDGWTYAPGDKNIEKKTSPYLRPWNEIPEDVKDYDRNTVRDLPIFLAEAGFDVYRITDPL
jgi:hypothetical protein